MKFKNFIKEYIEPFCIPYKEPFCYDAILYGSDQIWRHQFLDSNRLNPVYFGENELITTKSIAYAASMGKVDFNNNEETCVKEWLSKFDNVSVRERDLESRLTEIGIASTVVLDPTLLLHAEEWDGIIPTKDLIKEPYILFYNLIPGFSTGEVEKFAKSNNLRLVTMTSIIPKYPSKDVITTANPTTMISLIRYANFVLTSSYHGLVFSIIYKKDFFASFKENAGRAISLLEMLGIGDRLVECEIAIPSNPLPIDYRKVYTHLEINKNKSLGYIINSLHPE